MILRAEDLRTMMLHTIFTLLLFVFSVQAELEYAKDEYNNVATVAIGKYHYTVSKAKAFVSVISNDPKHKPCEKPIDKELFYVTGPLHATVMGNRQIVAWARQSVKVNFQPNKTRTNFLLMIVDPDTCHYVVPDILKDVTENGWQMFDPTVIAYKDTFDVFFPSQARCFPCRYNADGYTIQLHRHFPLDDESSPRSPRHPYHIQAILGDNHEVYGYIYASNLEYDSSVLRLIHPVDFGVLVSKEFRHYVVSVAVQRGGKKLIGACYAKNKYQTKVICEYFDEELKSITKTPRIRLGNGSIVPPGLQIDKFGNSYVAILRTEENDNDFYDTKVIELSYFDNKGRFKKTIIYRIPSEFLKVDTLLFKNEYACVAVVDKNEHAISSREPDFKTDSTNCLLPESSAVLV